VSLERRLVILAGARARRWLDLPEVNVAIFSFLLHLVWEFMQVPLFAGMPSAGHWATIEVCLQATVGDAVIAVTAFWGVAALTRSRAWILTPTGTQLLAFVGIGVVTIAMELLATQVLGRWVYSPTMPIVPIVNVGLSPLLQWMIVPLLMVWIVRRQLAGARLLRRQRDRATK
jgi:hypothetical protein